MKDNFLESGRIVNTHGVRGELKIEPWADSPRFLAKFRTIYVDGAPLSITKARVHNGFVIAAAEGITSIEEAEKFKGKTVYISRSDVSLPEGSYFISDLVGMTAVDSETEETLGTVSDVFSIPSGNICEIKGEREILVPIRSEFITNVDISKKIVTIHLIEGM